MKIRIVLFDAVGVLFPLNTAVGDDLAARFNLSEKQLQQMWEGFYPEYSVGELTTEAFLNTFANTYHLPRREVTEEIFVESFLKALTPMIGMENVLARLSNTGVTLAMLSDTTPMFAQSRRELVFSHYFDHIFLSFEIGYKKPDPRAFNVVTEYYRVPPEEVFFIDDSQKNVDAAKKLGMDAVKFINAKELTQYLERTGLLT